jgi:hypothetical protein
MKKFMALYMCPIAVMEDMMKNSTPEMMKAHMGEWMTWANACGSGLVDMGQPLGKTKRVTAEGASNVRNEISGYSIVQAESHDDAAKFFAQHPHIKLQGASVELIEIMPMPGAK